MAIIGLTTTESGETLQRLAIVTKVAIGEIKDLGGGKTRPEKLDHFVFLRKDAKLEWDEDPELMKHYGSACRSFSIILLDDDPENVFRTQLAWWTKTEKKCSGDGRTATRRTEKSPHGEDWTPCGDACPDRQAKRCKPSGDLYFVLADHPRLGAVCRLHTTSHRSVQQIHSAIEQIRTVTGGRLAGIRVQLAVRPEKTAYTDKDGSKKSTVVYALNLELSAQGMQKLVDQMTENTKLFESTKKLLGNGRRYVIEEEEEEERAIDVAPEFYPAEEIAPAAPAAPPIQQPSRLSTPPAQEPAPQPSPEPVSAASQADIWPRADEKKSGDGKANAVEFISAEQSAKLRTMIVERGYANVEAKRMLKFFWEIPDTAHVPVEKFSEVWAYFDSKGQQKPSAGDKPYQATDEDIPF
jgi:hypothetical protein